MSPLASAMKPSVEVWLKTVSLRMSHLLLAVSILVELAEHGRGRRTQSVRGEATGGDEAGQKVIRSSEG
jgi:hypothetical protein